MRIYENNTYRDMTSKEISELEMLRKENPAPNPDRLTALECENADLIKRIEKIEKDISDLQFESGGSVLPNPGTDPNPGFKPKPGGGLTIGG